MIDNENIRKILTKGPNYREPQSINWKYNFKQWRIVARTIGRFSFEVIKAEVLQYTFIIKDDL
jgi:hypothetical protein